MKAAAPRVGGTGGSGDETPLSELEEERVSALRRRCAASLEPKALFVMDVRDEMQPHSGVARRLARDALDAAAFPRDTIVALSSTTDVALDGRVALTHPVCAEHGARRALFVGDGDDAAWARGHLLRVGLGHGHSSSAVARHGLAAGVVLAELVDRLLHRVSKDHRLGQPAPLRRVLAQVAGGRAAPALWPARPVFGELPTQELG